MLVFLVMCCLRVYSEVSIALQNYYDDLVPQFRVQTAHHGSTAHLPATTDHQPSKFPSHDL